MDLKTYLASSPRGTGAKLAASLGISQSYFSQLVSGKSAISPARAVEIERLTHGVVSRRELRPHDHHLIWPDQD